MTWSWLLLCTEFLSYIETGALLLQVPPDMLSMEVTTETNPDERETQRDLESRYKIRRLNISELFLASLYIGLNILQSLWTPHLYPLPWNPHSPLSWLHVLHPYVLYIN